MADARRSDTASGREAAAGVGIVDPSCNRLAVQRSDPSPDRGRWLGATRPCGSGPMAEEATPPAVVRR